MATTQTAQELAAEMAAQAKTLRAEGKAKMKEAERMLDTATRLEGAARALNGDSPPRRRGRPRKAQANAER